MSHFAALTVPHDVGMTTYEDDHSEQVAARVDAERMLARILSLDEPDRRALLAVGLTGTIAKAALALDVQPRDLNRQVDKVTARLEVMWR